MGRRDEFELECVPDLHQRRDITTPGGAPLIRPPVFSGPPTFIDTTTDTNFQGRFVEISGFHVNIKKSGMPYQYIRNDGSFPTFLVLEGDDSTTWQISSAIAGVRAWVYASGGAR